MNKDFKSATRILNIMIITLPLQLCCIHRSNAQVMTKVRPFATWDNNKTLNGVSCNIHGQKVENSCAARNVSASSSAPVDIVKLAEGSLKALSFPPSDPDYNTLKNKLLDVFTKYKVRNCQGADLKACVINDNQFLVDRYNSNKAKKDQVNDIANTGNLSVLKFDGTPICKTILQMNYNDIMLKCKSSVDSCFASKVRARNFSLSDVQQILDGCNSTRRVANNRQLPYSDGIFVSSAEFLIPPPDYMSPENIQNKLKAYTDSDPAQQVRLFHEYDEEVVKPVKPVTTGEQVKFLVDTPTITSGEEDLILQIRMGLRIPGDLTPSAAPTYSLSSPIVNRYTSITITASSSTPSNGDYFCQKDFVNLSKARAFKIRDLIKLKIKERDSIDLPDSVFKINYMGTLNDGSSGDCAYCCYGFCNDTVQRPAPNPSPATGECVEVKIANYNSVDFRQYQQVLVVANASLINQPTGTTPLLEKILSLKTPRRFFSFGCKNQPVRGCFSELKDSSGKIIAPSNLVVPEP